MSHEPHAGHSSGGHEEEAIRSRPIYLSAIGLGIGVFLSFVAMWGLLQLSNTYLSRTSPPPDPLAASYGRKLPPEPRLQTEPILDLEQLRAKEKKQLDSYGWVDQTNGVVHIPIERAMELIAGSPAGAKGAH